MKRTFLEVKDNIKKTHEDNITLLNTTLPKYKEKLNLHCNICNNDFSATYDNLVNKGSGCPYCCGHLKTNDEFLNKLHVHFGDRLLYNKVQYINARTPITLICPKHGEFQKIPNKVFRGYGCPKCRCSRLEGIIMNKLSHKNIIFEKEKSFSWLGNLRLDFYLAQYNIAIECQGEQHFHQVYFNGKSENIEDRNLVDSIRKRDAKKFNVCTKHNVRLFYFVDENVATEEIEQNPIYKDRYSVEADSLIENIIKHC